MSAISKIIRLTLIVSLTLAAGVTHSETEYVEVVKLLAPDLAPTDHFGEFVAVDGDRIVVASKDWRSATGSVYVFDRNEGGSNSWGLSTKILAPMPQTGDLFGVDIDLDGDVLIVASGIQTPDTFYIYERASSGAWELTAEITEDPTGPVAVSGDTVIAGNAGEDRVYVYERHAGGPGRWARVAELGPSFGDPATFATRVAIDGDVVVAGAFGDDELAEDAGSAYVWERDEFGNWQEKEVAKLFASDWAEDDEFGAAVAVEESLVVVGAPDHDFPVANAGAAYLFRRDEFGNWNEIAKLTADDPEVGDVAGRTVAISDGRVVVGARGRDVGDMQGVGGVFIFEEDKTGVWSQVAELRSSDGAEGDWFGEAVGSSGGTVAVGAYLDDELGFNAGAAYVFQLVASPELELVGECPGEVTMTLSGATLSGEVLIGGSSSEGVTVIPGGACAGVELGLEDAQLRRRFFVDADGRAEFSRPVSAPFCGGFLQAIDRVTCGVGATSRVP